MLKGNVMADWAEVAQPDMADALADLPEDQVKELLTRASERRRSRKEREAALVKFWKDNPDHIPIW